MTTKIASKLPKSDEVNGLNHITADLVDKPDRFHVAVVVLDCSKVTTEIDTGESIPTARIRRIEIIDRPEDKARLQELATRALETRTGKTVLPLELEDELRSAFGSNPDDKDPA